MAVPNPITEPPATPASAQSEPERHLHVVEEPSIPVGEDMPTGAQSTSTTPEVVTSTVASSQWVAWLRTAFIPDSGLWSDRQPSVEETVRRARRGQQVAEAGPLRHLAVAHGHAAAVNKAVCHAWVWIVDHPARLAVVTALLTVALAWPPTRAVAALLLTPFTWAHAALT